MPHQLDLDDFRARRSVLDPADFALGGDEPEPPPSDLISQEAWDEIMMLPGDVAIRTTSHQGTRVARLHELWSAWVFSMPEQGVLSEAMLDASDDLDAALFNMIHGFYKQAITACRNALELMTFACACELYNEAHRWVDWQKGEDRLNFSENCVRTAAHAKLAHLEAVGQHTYGVEVSLFPSGRPEISPRKAWVSNLYGRLCEYAHPRGTNGRLWNSNGPIYSAEGFRTSYLAYLETYAVLVLLAKLAVDTFKIPDAADFLYDIENVQQYVPPEFQALCAYYGNTLGYAP